MTAIEYVSYADATGYGQAAVGYVRLLVNAGIDVHWKPYLNDALWSGRAAFVPDELARGRAAIMARGSQTAGCDLQTLIEATSRPVRPSLRVLHLLPRFWREQMQMCPGVPHVGMTVWETDKLNREWLTHLAEVERLIVPCAHNAKVIVATETPLAPVHVVPHVCRPILGPPSPPQLARLAKLLRIRPDDTVFYSINAWNPRKRMADLIDGFARCFTADDPVILVVKTDRRTWFDDPWSPPGDRDVANTVQAIVSRAEAETGRPSGRVTVITNDAVGDNVIDGLHTLGHCFVSLSRCEGFGLGCFDAATHGRPVIGVGYGGLPDYLGNDWPGRIPHRMVPCDAPREFGIFDQDQSWPEPDDATAFAHMRAFVRDRTPFVAAASWTSKMIVERFGPAPVGERLMAALNLEN